MFLSKLGILIFATAAHAANIDVATISADLSSAVTHAESDYTEAKAGPIYSQNVALISQLGDGNFGVISQSGTGNFAAIVTAPGNKSGVAFISQSGNGNFASIQQH